MNNLKSYTEYAVTSETTDFVIGFDFNYGTDAVNVTVDGVPANEAGYTVVYLNSTTMRLTPAVPTGVVRLQRETDIDVPYNSFTAGAKFIASNMDENFTQVRHAQQEVRDGFNKLSTDTYEIIDTLQDVGQAAQDAADAAEAAAQTANDAAAQVNDKVSYQDLDNAVEVAVTPVVAYTALPFKLGKSYTLYERVQLDSGDIVKNTIAGNTVDPNADMTGWENTASSNALFNETMLATTIRTLSSKLSDFQTLDDYGAIGDGTLKTLQHWINTGRFSSLAAIQMVYPNATSLTESIDAVCLQAMIDSNYGKRVYIKPKHYVINKPLRITQGISLIADQRSTSPYGYTATTAKLDFSSLSADQYAITILGDDNNNRITGVELDGFLLFGKQTVNAITIGESLSKDVTELIIRNTVCFNFKDALTTRYLYGATFDSFRAQSCVNGLLLGAQTNQVLFDRGGVVTISNTAISMSNCEGVQFESYNISNLTKSNGAPITMYQSQAIFTNSYFEYVTNPILAQVGTRAEATHIASTLVLDASLKLGEGGSFHDIQVANNNAYVELRGRARFGARVVGVDDSTSHVGSHVHGDNLRMDTNTYVENFGVGKWKSYVQYGGGVTTQALHRGFIRVGNTGSTGTGVRLSEKLVANELYTLSYAIKKTDDAQTVSLRNGSKSAVALPVADATASDVAIHHCSFVADDENLRLLFSGDIDIYGYTIQKGNLRTTDLTRFFVPDANTRFVTEGLAAPTNTGWRAGDVVFSFNNTGQLGWLCTSGTLNTWVTMGIIGATKAAGLTESSTASQIVAALKAAGLAV